VLLNRRAQAQEPAGGIGGWVACAIAIVAIAGLGGCERGGTNPGSKSEPSTPAPSTEVVRITGSSTLAPLVAELAAAFERRNPSYRIDVETGGSSRGIADVRRRTADIGMVSRALRADEPDLKGHLIARDGVSLIVHASNPVAVLSRDEIVGIFTGRLTNWRELNGTDLDISVVHKADGRSTQEVFLAHFGLRSADITPSVVIGDNQQGIKTVASVPGAIGYVSIGAAQQAVEDGGALRLLPLDGVEPTADAVRHGAFPLSRNLLLVTSGPSSDAASAFIDYVRSSETDETIREFSFVPARQ